MKQFVAIIALVICQAITADAQSFLGRLQKRSGNQGKITVHQDTAIDELVNGKQPLAGSYTPKTARQADSGKHTGTATKQQQADSSNGQSRKNTPGSSSAGADAGQADAQAADTHKKVMHKSYKVNGYRVQAFAGGNTRLDRQKAEKAGNDIKANFPDEPVYVHFYSPRWICRVGNYRSYEEAHQMLLSIRKLGYKQASIVKGKITVQY